MAAAHTETTTLPTMSTGRQPSCGWPPATRPTKPSHEASLAPDAFRPDGFDFDRVAAAGSPGPRTVVGHHDSGDRKSSRAADRLAALQAAQPWGQPYAPADGWDWGSNGRILNNLVVLAVAHQLTGDGTFRDARHDGMDYLLGRNALGQSYVTGYGTRPHPPPAHPPLRHDLDPAFPPAPAGRARRGPDSKTTQAFPPIPAWIAGCRRNAATSTSRRRRPPTTFASAGTLRSYSCPPGSRHDRRVDVRSRFVSDRPCGEPCSRGRLAGPSRPRMSEAAWPPGDGKTAGGQSLSHSASRVGGTPTPARGSRGRCDEFSVLAPSDVL